MTIGRPKKIRLSGDPELQPILNDRDGLALLRNGVSGSERLIVLLWKFHPWGDERVFDRDIPMTRRIA